MTTRLRLLVALTCLLALVATACNGEADDEAADEPEAPEEPADEEPAEDPGDEEPAEDPADGEAPDDLGLEQEGQLRVGSDLDFAPFEFIEDGEPQGFDIDLMDEIAGRLDLEVEYVDASFDTIFTQLAAGEFDAIISAITITEERRQTIEFTDPYFAANQALVVLADSDIAGVEDLTDVDIGAQAGTTGLDYANENFTEATVVEFPTYPAAFTALESGQLDAVLADLPVAAEQVEGSDTLELVEEVDTDENYGIGVQQDNEALRDAFNEQLAAIIEDGTYEQIYSEWFEGDVPQQFQN